LLRQHSDIGPACELHTHKLWEPFADANGDTDGHSYGYSYGNSFSNCYSNGYGYSYGNCDSNGDRDRTATVYTDATASSDAATSPVGSGTS
jgi:hypothetical protein